MRLEWDGGWFLGRSRGGIISGESDGEESRFNRCFKWLGMHACGCIVDVLLVGGS